jgi:small-conductance mechanosensitive channel
LIEVEFQVVVEEMNIMTTVFLRYDNLKIYYPNSVLATKPIFNFYRSPDMGEGVDFSIHVATPVEKLTLMKARILRCVFVLPLSQFVDFHNWLNF